MIPLIAEEGYIVAHGPRSSETKMGKATDKGRKPEKRNPCTA